MIRTKKHVITRAPYRISLGGGGTDLPFYASNRGGYLLTAAIDEYLTVMVAKRTIDTDIFLQYSDIERVKNVDHINHKIIREVLKYFKVDNSFQVSTFSTMPTFTGLGASSTLIVALLSAIRNIKNITISKIKLAEEAFYIEREVLRLSGGYQDQYIASLGGIQILEVEKNLRVNCTHLNLDKEIINELEKKLILVYTQLDRKSDKIIDSQIGEFNRNENLILKHYDKIKEIGKESVNCIIDRNWKKLGLLMDDHWKVKKMISEDISNSKIDEMYLDLKSCGAVGGKIIGAGGGGFLLMLVNENEDQFKKKALDRGYKIIEYKIDFKGVHSFE